MRDDETPTDEQVLAAFPTAAIDEDNVDHYRGRLQRRLMINRCNECSTWHHPPRHFCPRCWSSEVVAVEVSGVGTVELSTVLFIGTPKSDIDYGLGHRLGAVRLDDAPAVRFTAQLSNLPGDVEVVGLRVRLSWTLRDQSPLPVFVPVGEAL